MLREAKGPAAQTRTSECDCGILKEISDGLMEVVDTKGEFFPGGNRVGADTYFYHLCFGVKLITLTEQVSFFGEKQGRSRHLKLSLLFWSQTDKCIITIPKPRMYIKYLKKSYFGLTFR
jgi:hypothetical protein